MTPLVLAAVGLTVSEPPRPPRDLAMRAPAPAPSPSPAPADRFTTVVEERAEPLSDKVIFHLQLGEELTQGQLTRRPQASGAPLLEDSRNTRSFVIGQLAAGTDGWLVPELSTYLAAHFRFDQDGALVSSASLPTAFDASAEGRALLIRSGFAELADLPGWMRPLRLRAGRQFRYGLAVAHFDGVSASWDARRFSLAGFAGQKVSWWERAYLTGGDNQLSERRPPPADDFIGGASGEARLYTAAGRPLALAGEMLAYRGEVWSQVQLRYEARSELEILSFVRRAPEGLARWGGGFHARLSPTATLHVDAEYRLADDWAYDLVVRAHTPGDAFARFLHLGPAHSELYLTARGGMVLLDNLDVQLGLAGAAPSGEQEDHHPWAVPWLEVSGAVDAGVRANLQVAVGGRIRRFLRPELDDEQMLDQFADVTGTGELGVYDGTLRMRYSTGRKRFAAEFDLLLRYTQSVHLERPRLSRLPLERYDVLDADSGVRLLVEAWMGERVRFLGDYQVTSAPKRFEEIRGLQVLRVLAEVSF